ncbi:MAG: NAD(P)/FAD-dependent oxidoreductase [Flavobacterium sp.]
MWDVLIIGGGAAGFFTAINVKEKNPKLKVAILERGKEVLTKVKISGGGRCNVTHACFEPNVLVKNYPRGEKELRGPFHQFQPQDTMDWFAKRGVKTHTEADGRMFPTTNNSQTIIDCFLEACSKLQIPILTNHSVQSIQFNPPSWEVQTTNGLFAASKVVVATGSNPKIWQMLHELGHQIVPSVPSLFTFNIKDERISDLMGVSHLVEIKVKGNHLVSNGPMLITHWGMSGPAILKLSAWGARILAEKNYQFEIQINFLPDLKQEMPREQLLQIKNDHPKKKITKNPVFGLTQRLWENLVLASGILEDQTWADTNKKQMNQLVLQLTEATFTVNGKSTFKEEFVTAGGVQLKEVSFKTLESKILPGLYLAGEVLDIDAITGGFNFQNCWTGGWLISEHISGK